MTYDVHVYSRTGDGQMPYEIIDGVHIHRYKPNPKPKP
jgi:hypothetical protein